MSISHKSTTTVDSKASHNTLTQIKNDNKTKVAEPLANTETKEAMIIEVKKWLATEALEQFYLFQRTKEKSNIMYCILDFLH